MIADAYPDSISIKSERPTIASPDYDSFLKSTSREYTRCATTPRRWRSDQSDEDFNRLIDDVVERYYEKKRIIKELTKCQDLYDEKVRLLRLYASKEELVQLKTLLQ